MTTNTELMTVREVADFLKTTPKTIYTYICSKKPTTKRLRNKLPQNLYIKFGHKVLFKKQELLLWVESGAPMDKD